MAKPSVSKAPPDVRVTLAVAGAECDGLSAERIRQLIKQGFIEGAIPGRGKIPGTVPLRRAMLGVIRFGKDEARRTSKSASASRVQDARAREIELKTAEREGRLMAVEEVRAVVAEWGAILRTGFSGIPARITRDMTFRRKIETEIDDVFRQATEHFAKAMGGRRGPAVGSAADAGDHPGRVGRGKP